MSEADHPTGSIDSSTRSFCGKHRHATTGTFLESLGDLPIELGIELDRLCNEFESAWGVGRPRSVEDALIGIVDSLRPAAVRELVALDVFYHREAGGSPRAEDYAARFPDLDPEWLARVVAGCERPTSVASTRADEKIGSVIAGRYTLVAAIGEGGMGTVYRASQTEPVKRQVAIKLIKAGLDSKTTQARFEAERQALAMMDHPNIAKIFDGGVTSDGHPYFVMELVKGVPITEFCDAQRLTPQQRLDLFIPVCRAIQHAHQKGIIHRDIKPSNILVTLYDEKPVPKVIDFGVAKATGILLTENTFQTGSQAIVGTLPYMSPEQASLNQHDIDTRSDVYSLGVVLYELLTGSTPVEKARFWTAAMLEMLRVVQEEEPPRASTRLSTTENRASIAATRGMEPRRLSKLLRGELDWILLKALEKDRGRRYQSATGLARDLERYLADDVVEARPPSVGYRMRKFFRKYRVPVIATSFVILALIGGVIGTSVGLYQAAAETKRANQQKDAALKAEREGREQLFQTLVSEAWARRYSQRIGQRFRTLDAIRQAVALAHELEKPPEAFAELRNLAIVALTLPDLNPTAEWMSEPDEPDWHTEWKALDPNLQWQALSDLRTGAVSLRRVGKTPADSGEIARLPGMGGEVKLTSSADGRFLAVRHWQVGGPLKVWKVDTPVPTLAMETLPGCTSVAFGLNEQIITGHPEGYLRISDRRTGKVIRSFPNPGGIGDAIECHPRLPLLALSGSTNRVVIYDYETAKTIAQIPLWVGGVAWHPDGELIAFARSDSVEVWDFVHNRRCWSQNEDGGGLRIAFNIQGDVLKSCGWRNLTRFWNPYTGQQIFVAKGFPSDQFGLDNRLVLRQQSAQELKSAPLYQLTRGDEYRTLVPGIGQAKLEPSFFRASVHPGGRLLAVETGLGLSFMDLRTGRELQFLPSFLCESLLFEPSGALITTNKSGVYRWPVTSDATNPQVICIDPPIRLPLPLHLGHIVQTSDGATLAATANGGAVVWHRDRPADFIRLGPHNDCRSVAISSDGLLVATGSHHSTGIKVWNRHNSEKPIREFLPNTKMTTPFFTPDGRLGNVAGESWRVAEWVECPREPAGIVVSAPVGNLAALESAEAVIPLIDSITGRELARLEDPNQNNFHELIFSPDGTQLIGVTRDTRCVRVWDLRRIRAGLAELKLDWEAPPYDPAPSSIDSVSPLRIELNGVEAIDYNSNPVATQKNAVGKRNALVTDTLDRAQIHIHRGELDGAKKACVKATELLKPAGANDSQVPLVREVALALGMDHPEVVDLITAAIGKPPVALNYAIAQNPNNADGYRNRGNWYGERGQWDAAIEDFVQVFRLDSPDKSPFPGL